MSKIEDFIKERERLNEIVLDNSGKDIKRFFTLDGAVYKEGYFSEKVKESMGLVASLVLRCDDCINYHILQCKSKGLTDGELDEILSIGLIVGGSIVIPHLRRALGIWEELKGVNSELQV
ncbi:MAG: carboxymuconolactone decarboxylase family protein [Candidatus Delongbacteria bacterium]|nr:carboxymuconolactone decarboxylase family protein [Candidatus Delongbacteria bacterium]MBN2835150.1 carboxymuconolactone decarboxylase family protein [Candidatus Delongbacteria bacterium]